MKTIREIDISDKRIFIRIDVNVPLDKFRNITDDTRIRGVLPTIQYAMDHRAKVILASHLGRPKGKVVPEMSLKPVAKRLGRYLKKSVEIAPDCIGPEVESLVEKMVPGDVLLLENLRFHPGEQDNNEDFAKALAKLSDVYVNDAFAVCHRYNASVEAITRFAPVCAAGFLLQNELSYFKKAFDNPSRPLVAIIGGAKISSKLAALENMMGHVDKFLVGGAMANTFLKSMGMDIGRSKIEKDLISTAERLMKIAGKKGIKFYLPVDAVVCGGNDAEDGIKIVPVQEVPENWSIMDIGPATIKLYQEVLADAKTIIWNGPMGVFEEDAFSQGTITMAHIVAESFALSIVGGGDTDVAIHKAEETDRITYISTGGGAFLALLEGEPLPGVAALDR
ncbi:MAG: phosphoglycerate kinase [Desulfobacterales bacterium]